MTSLKSLKKEHEKINRELIELETIMSDEETNYPNLIHVFKNLIPLWNSHEEKEEKFLELNKVKSSELNIDKIAFQHKDLSGHKAIIKKAFESGSDFKIKLALDIDGRMIIEKLRNHMEDEEKIFDEMYIKKP